MLARLQQLLTLSAVAGALGWLVYWWDRSVPVALSGAAIALFGYAAVLGLEFILMQQVNRQDPVPRARPLAVWRAWWLEVCSGPAIFCWRQPFFSNAEPDFLPARPGPGDPAVRGVVLIHGFVCNRGFWTPWLKRLRQRGRPFVAVNLEPVFGDIDDYVPIIEAAVENATRATGLPPVLLCHSMGGLAARAWLRAHGADHRVAHVFTIGSPHQGTWLGRFSHAPSGRQMCERSEWVMGLCGIEPPQRRALFTCFYSDCDNIVFPTSTAALPGADNRFVAGAPHVHMAFDARVVEQVLGKIDAL